MSYSGATISTSLTYLTVIPMKNEFTWEVEWNTVYTVAATSSYLMAELCHMIPTLCVCVFVVCVCVCVCVCARARVCVCRGRDGGGVEDGGGAAAAYARREEERAKERRNHTTKRRKQSQFWDLAPRGFEHISPLQYKAMQGRDGLCSHI